MKNSKHMILAVVMIVTLGFVTAQSADARGKGRWQDGYDCRNANASLQWDEETLEKRSKFHEENRELRKGMITKKAELRAIMQQDNPDAAKVGKLSAEIFDLRETLHKKAEAAGLPGPGMQNVKCGGPECQGPFSDRPQKMGRRTMWN